MKVVLSLVQNDSTTFITPDHHAEIDDVANILIWPEVSRSENVTRATVPKAILDPIIVQLVEGISNRIDSLSNKR